MSLDSLLRRAVCRRPIPRPPCSPEPPRHPPPVRPPEPWCRTAPSAEGAWRLLRRVLPERAAPRRV